MTKKVAQAYNLIAEASRLIDAGARGPEADEWREGFAYHEGIIAQNAAVGHEGGFEDLWGNGTKPLAYASRRVIEAQVQ